MARPRYSPKKKKKTPSGEQAPNRGHGTQMKPRTTHVGGANGDSNGSSKSLLGGRLGTKRELLSQKDRRLMEELTEALRENSALLREQLGAAETKTPVQTKPSADKVAESKSVSGSA